jgi:hypothetical protein
LPGILSKVLLILLIQPSPKKPTRQQAAKRVVEVPEEIFELPATVSRYRRISRKALFHKELLANKEANQTKK